MYKNFTLVIPTYNSSKYMEELLNSALNLSTLNEVIITDDNSEKNEIEKLESIINLEKFKNLNIVFHKNNVSLGGFKNKLKGVELSSNEIIYQIDSDNVITKKTTKFLNNYKNLNLIRQGEIYLPSKINLFRKFKYLENLLFFRKNDVLFTKKNISLKLYDVQKELNTNKNFFKDRTLKSILNIGNPIILKSDYIKFTKATSKENVKTLAACSIALSYCYLANNGKIIFNKNLGHFHRLRKDSAWNVGGESSKISDLHFLSKINDSTIKKETSKQKIHFVTYGTKNFRVAKKHLMMLASESSLFDSVIGLSQKSLSDDFKSKYRNILKESRGAGYWIWKHEIIKNVLDEIKENDILVYSDAGSSFNYYAKNRFSEYIEVINNSEFGNFLMECESKHKEIQWTSSKLLEYFNVEKNSEIAQSTQLEATHMIFKKNDHTKHYFEDYTKLLNFDMNLITDKYNHINKHDAFKENRHDQSIFSLLTKTLGGEIIPNETHFLDNKELQYNYPFLAVRKHGHGLKDSLKFISNYEQIRSRPVYFK